VTVTGYFVSLLGYLRSDVIGSWTDVRALLLTNHTALWSVRVESRCS